MGRNTARRVIPLFRPYRGRVAAVVGLIVLTSTIGIVNPLLIQAVFSKALFVPGGPGRPPRPRSRRRRGRRTSTTGSWISRAHRLSTIVNADVINVIDGGRGHDGRA